MSIACSAKKLFEEKEIIRRVRHQVLGMCWIAEKKYLRWMKIFSVVDKEIGKYHRITSSQVKARQGLERKGLGP